MDHILMVADAFKIDQAKADKRVALFMEIFVLVASILVYAKNGFHLPWTISYVIAALFTILYTVFVLYCGKRKNS